VILLEGIVHSAIDPALALLPPQLDSREARIMLLAIGLQESRFMHRFQKVVGQPYVKGPARSFWQFELGSQASRGGVWGVVLHDASRFWVSHLCAKRDVPFRPDAIHQAIENDDVLAAGLARLLLFTDPRKLPAVNAPPEEAWQLYLRTWRPGKPHRHTWDEFHKAAQAQVLEAMA
jgi:hypothetical protein